MYRFAKKIVNNTIEQTGIINTKIRQRTIHQVKGKTLKATIFVSSKNSSGTGDRYWKN